jgi:hypothetical protein
MAKTMAPADAGREDVCLVDNPYCRESHRPWYARRAARGTVGLAILGLLLVNALAVKKVGRRADPISVDTARARYRATTSTQELRTDAPGSPGTSVPSTTAVGAASAGVKSPTQSIAADPTGNVGVVHGPTPAPGVFGDADSVIGPTHFHEEISLGLAEPEPRQ